MLFLNLILIVVWKVIPSKHHSWQGSDIVFDTTSEMSLLMTDNMKIKPELLTNSNKTHKIKQGQTAATNKIKKIQILLWNKLFGRNLSQWKPFDSCPQPFNMCELIDDKHKISTSDAILFDMRHVTNVRRLPHFRKPAQVWIMFIMESPVNNYLHYK